MFVLLGARTLADTAAVQSTARNLELEAAAFANPDDLDVWRVFADWLLSQGDARGEIASLAVHRQSAFLSERKALTDRIAELERTFVDAWHEWKQAHDLLDVEVTFKRGFVYSVEGSLTQMQPVFDQLFERNPIQRLTLTDVDPDTITRLFERRPAWLPRLRYLKLRGQLDADALAALAAIELPELRRLNLLGTGIEETACQQLARLQTRALEHLTLTSNEIEQTGLAKLLSSPTRGQWRALYLSGNPIDSDALALLAADQQLALTSLHLRQIAADLGDFVVFADRAAIPTLTQLEMDPHGYWQPPAVQAVLDQLRERFGSRLICR